MKNFLQYDVIFVREYFPSNENPSVSSWVLNQAIGLIKNNIKPIVISPTPNVPNWIKRLRKDKHSWKIIPNKQLSNYKEVDVIRYPFIKLPNTYFFKYNMRALNNCIFKSGKRIKANLIHAHFGHAGIVSVKLKIFLKIPLITSFYGFDLGSDKQKLNSYYKDLSKEGDLFLALSEDMKKDLIEIGFPKEKIIVHHLGVNLEEFKPLNNNNIAFTFLIVASFTERKGIHYTIEAYNQFCNEYPEINSTLKIIGDGNYKSKLLSLAESNKQIVFINNHISENPRKLVREEMQKCDVFILTSITLPDSDKEGTPVVLMEAQACGKPCIATYHAGIPEVVIDNKTGVLVKERSSEEIKNAMVTLFFNTNLRNNYGENARIHIKKKFNNDIQIPILKNIYNSLLNNKI